MSLAGYVLERGVTCCACGRDVSAGGVSPGDGFLYCEPCHRNGAMPVIEGQLAFDLEVCDGG